MPSPFPGMDPYLEQSAFWLNEKEPLVHLQKVFSGVYERARYAARIDYNQPIPPPALSVTNRQLV
ncbi:MAG: DUF4058 family protein [Rhizonema sp. PD38]|nr:DUF4058 family protein [Rhizonema sp. PD38]